MDQLADENRISRSNDTAGNARTSHLESDRVDVLYEEQGLVRTEWLPVERVRVRRRIVTEIQTIEVEVRREELLVEHEVAPVSPQALPVGCAPAGREPYVTVLHREVPYIRLEVEPYEQAAVRVMTVESQIPVSLDLKAEHSRVDVTH
jgi:uncharacterized protein DUF2382